MNKQAYEKPCCDVICFKALDDIVTASGGIVDNNTDVDLTGLNNDLFAD